MSIPYTTYAKPVSKMLKFGTIAEDNHGRLVFTGFHIDGDGSMYMEQAILTAVIQRLQRELLKFNRSAEDGRFTTIYTAPLPRRTRLPGWMRNAKEVKFAGQERKELIHLYPGMKDEDFMAAIDARADKEE